MRAAVLLIPFALALAACGGPAVLNEASWKWKDGNWIHGDVRSMTFDVQDTTVTYRLDLDVTHTTDYGYQNLYVRTVTNYPSGKAVTSVTSLELAEKDGTWAGDCSGKTCSLRLPLQAHFTFPEPGHYTWSIEPYMRTDTVRGIRSLTVTCSEVAD